MSKKDTTTRYEYICEDKDGKWTLVFARIDKSGGAHVSGDVRSTYFTSFNETLLGVEFGLKVIESVPPRATAEETAEKIREHNKNLKS